MNIVEKVTEIAEQVERYKDTPLYNKVVALQADIIELSRSRNKLEQEVDLLKQKQDNSKAVTITGGLFYFNGEPICPRCWEKAEKISRLIGTEFPDQKACLQCNAVFSDAGTKGNYYYRGVLGML